ncbi:MAG: hypothetical protein JXA54_07850 [Candidatus Heimdallarchaeota archaeon]|nr:hypothetical protein [Candidatus Heimdallarchaeota archaeon]
MLFNSPINYLSVISGIIALVISFLILIKDIRASLNILFFTSLFFWSLMLIFNGLTFIFKHPTLGANIIRDCVTSFGSLSAFLIFITSFIMYNGEHYLKKWYFIIPISAITIINSFISSYFDYVVYDSPNGIIDLGIGIKTTQAPWVKIFLYGIPLIMILLAIIYLALTRKDVVEIIIKKRILYFIFGFALIIAGILIYGISGLFEQLSLEYQGTFEHIAWISAALCWSLAPILMVIGFYRGRLNEKINNYK